MKVFGYSEWGNYELTCGVIIAENEEEATKIAHESGGGKVFEIPQERGYYHIDSYIE